MRQEIGHFSSLCHCKISQKKSVGKGMIKDDGTSNKLDMFQGFTSVKVSAAQNKRRRLGLKHQEEEAIYDVINEGGSTDDLASGTNPVVDDYDDK